MAFPAGQCISPQLHPCHRLFDQDEHQDSSLPSHSPDVAPCDFCLFPKLRGSRYETIEKMKEAGTKVIDTLTQEDFHGALHKLLEWYNCIAPGGYYFEWGLEFHVCTINKSVHTKEVWKPILWYLYIYIYIYIYIVIHRQICFVLSELISVARQYLPVAGIETRLTQTPSQSF